MSFLKSRVVKLEAASMKESNRISHVARFIVDPGPIEVAGYRCNDKQILRLPEDSLESLQKRCVDTIAPEGDFYVTFFPVY
jgi:hypothetical protein